MENNILEADSSKISITKKILSKCFLNTFLSNMKHQALLWLKEISSYEIKNFNTFNAFVKWMHRPTDAAALGIFRLFFGLAMLIDIPEERGGSILDIHFGDPKYCHFPLFDFIKPLPLPHMGIIFLIMWLGALGISIGYKFRISCLMFIIPYWYIFLLNKAAWNNHSYLYGLCGLLFLFSNAHHYCSIDGKNLSRKQQIVPYWNYFLFKFQFFILYFMAGLKKMTIEWLSGYSMTNLGYHWIFSPFRLFLSVRTIELWIIHWFTAIFDLTIAFWLTYKKTRLAATPFVISFHLMNSRLFTIGMFPWVCLAELPLFYSVDWPRNIFHYKSEHKNLKKINNKDVNKEDNYEIEKTIIKTQKSNIETIKNLKSYPKEKTTVFIILIYCFLQIFLPYSHFITKGYNNWTNGLYGYSWDMMVHAYDTSLISIQIVDNNNKKVHFLEPFAFTEYDRWTKHADMAIQYAHCIHRNLINDFDKSNNKSLLTSKNISIYFDIWCSMNGRFEQRIFNPNIDLLKASWSPFKETEWLLPILTQFTEMRPKLNAIIDDVLSWNNYSDVLFMADFPTLILDNYILPELDNVSLTVLYGFISIENYTSKTVLYNLGPGQSIKIPSGHIHRVKTLDSQPSCYIYTFINKTMKDQNIIISPIDTEKPLLPIIDEINNRFHNFIKFLYHLGNSIMFLVYNVPIPIEIREPYLINY